MGNIWNSANSFKFVWSIQKGIQIQNGITNPEHQFRENPLSGGHPTLAVNRNPHGPGLCESSTEGFVSDFGDYSDVILTFIVLIVWHLFYPMIVPSKLL